MKTTSRDALVEWYVGTARGAGKRPFVFSEHSSIGGGDPFRHGFLLVEGPFRSQKEAEQHLARGVKEDLLRTASSRKAEFKRFLGRDPGRQAHEMREINIFFNDLKRVDKLPLADRKENAQRFAEELRSPGGLEVVAERVGWLLGGNYGEGAQIKAMQVARSPRMNQAAYLVQTIVALEWLVPPAMTIAAWRTLSMAQRNKLDRLVKEEIKDALGSA